MKKKTKTRMTEIRVGSGVIQKAVERETKNSEEEEEVETRYGNDKKKKKKTNEERTGEND